MSLIPAGACGRAPSLTCSTSNDPDNCASKNAEPPSRRRSGASGTGAPSLAAPANGVSSGVDSGVSYTVATDRRPELTMRRANSALGASASTALRRRRSASECGAMKSVERVEWQDVLVRRPPALELVAVEQRGRGFAAQDRGKLPGEILGILDAGIAAARAERRDLVGGIADEDHPAMDEARRAAGN